VNLLRSINSGIGARARLAEVLGHELRNPLASAVASIGVTMEMTDPGDPRAAFLDRAMQELSRVSALLTSYLELGRSDESGREEIDLVEVVSAAAQRFRTHPARIEFEVATGDETDPAARDDAGSEPVRLLGHPVLLERLVENLIENALSMGATRVDLYLEREPDECVLHVSDDGPGVPLEMRDQLFDPFVSGRGSSGLGLALCKDVVEIHGGSITLVPSIDGAMFRVSIPAPWR
jgi:signal transduction histidine kinase